MTSKAGYWAINLLGILALHEECDRQIQSMVWVFKANLLLLWNCDSGWLITDIIKLLTRVNLEVFLLLDFRDLTLMYCFNWIDWPWKLVYISLDFWLKLFEGHNPNMTLYNMSALYKYYFIIIIIFRADFKCQPVIYQYTWL